MTDFLSKYCDRCGETFSEWTVREARFDVGRISSKLQLCGPCTLLIEQAIWTSLRSHMRPHAATRAPAQNLNENAVPPPAGAAPENVGWGDTREKAD